MRYHLFVTRRCGCTVKALNGPFDTRDDTRRVILANVHGNAPGPASTTDTVFARRASEIPLGETITHAATGIVFRTERV